MSSRTFPVVAALTLAMVGAGMAVHAGTTSKRMAPPSNSQSMMADHDMKMDSMSHDKMANQDMKTGSMSHDKMAGHAMQADAMRHDKMADHDMKADSMRHDKASTDNDMDADDDM